MEHQETGAIHRTPKTKMKRGITIEIRMTVCEIFLNGWRSSQKISKIQKCLHPLCHLKNPELEPKFQKYKGRVVLRGDTVEAESGSHAAASQMHDFGHLCFGRRIQMSGHSGFGIFNNVGASSILTSVQTDTASAAGPAHPGSFAGPVWKTQSFLLSEICTIILWQDYCEKGNSRKFY